jgi:hypothetical protein
MSRMVGAAVDTRTPPSNLSVLDGIFLASRGQFLTQGRAHTHTEVSTGVGRIQPSTINQHLARRGWLSPMRDFNYEAPFTTSETLSSYWSAGRQMSVAATFARPRVRRHIND